MLPTRILRFGSAAACGLWLTASALAQTSSISATALQQIQAVLADKAAHGAPLQKVDSVLIYTAMAVRGQSVPGVPQDAVSVSPLDLGQRASVDIRGTVSAFTAQRNPESRRNGRQYLSAILLHTRGCPHPPGADPRFACGRALDQRGGRLQVESVGNPAGIHSRFRRSACVVARSVVRHPARRARAELIAGPRRAGIHWLDHQPGVCQPHGQPGRHREGDQRNRRQSRRAIRQCLSGVRRGAHCLG